MLLTSGPAGPGAGPDVPVAGGPYPGFHRDVRFGVEADLCEQGGDGIGGTGLIGGGVRGQGAGFFFPEDQRFITEEFLPKVLREGAGEVEVRFRHFKTGAALWMSYNVIQVRDAQGRVSGYATVSRNITELKWAQEALRRSEELHTYLLDLSDALRPLKNPIEIQEAAARFLGERLRAERALYFEVRGQDYVIERDYAKGVPQLRGRFPVGAFGPKLWEEIEAGRTVVVKDVETDGSLSAEERLAYAAVQIGAHVGVPLVKGGRLVAGLVVHAKELREWTEDEVELIEETAERTWAAVGRARAEEALRESEENYRTLFTSIDEGFCVIELLLDQQGKANDWRFLEVNPAFERHNGLMQATGKRMRELTPDIEEKWFEIYGKVANTGQPVTA